MRFYKSIVCVILSALLSCFIIYPFLHEGGHALAILLMKGNVVGFSLFPFPFVVCDSTLSELQKTVVALSGNILPVVMLYLPIGKRLFGRCTLVMTGTVSAAFCIVSVISAFVSMPYDDISHLSDGLVPLYCILNCVCLVAILFRIFKLKFFGFLTFYLSKAP